jgi:hypothetical protein
MIHLIFRLVEGLFHSDRTSNGVVGGVPPVSPLDQLVYRKWY